MSLGHACRSRLQSKLDNLKVELEKTCRNLQEIEKRVSLESLTEDPEQLKDLIVKLILTKDLIELTLENVDKKIKKAGSLSLSD